MLSVQLQSARGEATQLRSEITENRHEISRVLAECEKAREIARDLENALSSLKQSASAAELCHGDTERTCTDTNNQIRALEQLYDNSQTKHEDLEVYVRMITMAHEKEKSEWTGKLLELHTSLGTKESTIEMIKKEHVRAQGELQQQITSLSGCNANLRDEVSKLTCAMGEAEGVHAIEISNARLEMDGMRDKLSNQQYIAEELRCTIRMGEEKETQLRSTIAELEEDSEALVTVTKESLRCKTTLSFLAQFFGVDMYTGEPRAVLDRVRVQKEASVERIADVLKRTCIQVIKKEYDPYGHYPGEQHEMDTASDPGEMFKEYESQIHTIIRTLSTEHTAMDVSGYTHSRQRPKRTSVKRKKEPNVSIDSAADHHPTLKKQECKRKGAHSTNPGYRVYSDIEGENPRFQLKPKSNRGVKHLGDCCMITQPDTWVSSVQKGVSVHNGVHTFDIELCQGNHREDTDPRVHSNKPVWTRGCEDHQFRISVPYPYSTGCVTS